MSSVTQVASKLEKAIVNQPENHTDNSPLKVVYTVYGLIYCNIGRFWKGGGGGGPTTPFCEATYETRSIFSSFCRPRNAKTDETRVIGARLLEGFGGMIPLGNFKKYVL